MDASASSKIDADNNDVYALFLKIENTDFPTPLKQRSTVIKYTKLPEFNYDPTVQWPVTNYTLKPRLRRIITLDEPRSNTSRSLQLDPYSHISAMATNNISNRKIVTISEDEEYDLHPKFSKEVKRPSSAPLNKAVETDSKKDAPKQVSQRNRSRLAPAKVAKETRCVAKISNTHEKREPTSRSNYKSKVSNQASLDNIRTQTAMDRETRKSKSASLSKTSLSKNLIRPSESEQEVSTIKTKLKESMYSKPSKKGVERIRGMDSPITPKKSKALLLEMLKQRKVTPVIHVPLEEKPRKRSLLSSTVSSHIEMPDTTVHTKSDGFMDTEIVLKQDVTTSTEPPPGTVDQVTDMEGYEPQVAYKCIESSDLQAELITEAFDKLVIPNVSLKKEKVNFKDELLDLHSKSLPNLQIPLVKMKDNRKEKSVLDTHYSKSTSYIISKATLTYKTQQNINVEVVDSKEKAYSNQSPSPLTYPMNVVSVFKEEMRSKNVKKDISLKKIRESKSSKEYKNCVNEIKSLNCSYFPNSNKLLKPSDIISTIRVNNGLLQSVLVCEQFQRELNFIDSFFESLQYLESCSLSGKCYKKQNIDQLVKGSQILESQLDTKKTDYDGLFSKLENGTNISDDETIASKNLFLLNILIRDEQRRAKNLLSVLKRREDALKDFTKSQILYLENKKRQENTDISALKKKQRGALLKLQHECGEMQRMRKALLALSEKRKVALMKTKKDLELRLKNDVHVDQIIHGKKKLKRNIFIDRTSVPLKCFDLSSSGCDDSTTYASEAVASAADETSAVPVPKPVADVVTSAEKSIQAGDSILCTSLVERATNTTDENFVVVDGGYLNILFQNLCLPQIFSRAKQYEVNQEALKNIVDSTNSRRETEDSWNYVVDKLVNQPKNEEDDNTSTPSTARSLVEEFEQYYKSLAEDDRLQEEEERSKSSSNAYETGEAVVQTSLCKIEIKASAKAMTECGVVECVVTEDEWCDCALMVEPCEPPPSPPQMAGPLPVPAGAPRGDDSLALDGVVCSTIKSSDTSAETSANSQALILLQDPPSLREVPPTLLEMAPALQEVPLAPREVPPALQQVPLAVLEVPSALQEVPPVLQEVPPEVREVPPAVQEVTPAVREVPPALREVPPVQEEVPLAPQEDPPVPLEVPPTPLPLEPTQAEAEELRRQQLAIEREIKELEQQSRLLVVREIPDKPPPPYTPPVEARPPKQPRPFRPDDVTYDRIRNYVTKSSDYVSNPEDAFDVLVHDFCDETIRKYEAERSDKPWDACNLLPQKPPLDSEKLISAVSTELDEVLSEAAPSKLSGVSSRRSDHIDDILFAEWGRAEPEWTSLHADDALVKNQLFETIFQRILTKTVDEYKRTVLSPPPVRD